MAARRSRSCSNSISCDKSRMQTTSTFSPLNVFGEHVHSTGITAPVRLTRSFCVAEAGRRFRNTPVSCAVITAESESVSADHMSANDCPTRDGRRDPRSRRPSRFAVRTVSSWLRTMVASGNPSRRSTTPGTAVSEAAVRRRYGPWFLRDRFITRLVPEYRPDGCRC